MGIEQPLQSFFTFALHIRSRQHIYIPHPISTQDPDPIMKFTTALLALIASVSFVAATPTDKETPPPEEYKPPVLTTICKDYPTCSAVYKTKTKSYEKPTTKYYTTTIIKHVTETTEVPTTVYSTFEKKNTKYITSTKTKTIKVPEVKHTHTRVCYNKPIKYTTYKEVEKKYPVTDSSVYTKHYTKAYPSKVHSTYVTDKPYPQKTSDVKTETKYHTYSEKKKECKNEHKCETKTVDPKHPY